MKMKLIISFIIAPFLTVGVSYGMNCSNNLVTIKSIDCSTTGQILVCKQNYDKKTETSTSQIQLYTRSNDIEGKKYSNWKPLNEKTKIYNCAAATFTPTNTILLHYTSNQAHEEYEQNGKLTQKYVNFSIFNPKTTKSNNKTAVGHISGTIKFTFNNKTVAFTGHKPITVDEKDKYIHATALDFNTNADLLAVGFANGIVKVYATKTIEEKAETKKVVDIEPLYTFDTNKKSNPTEVSISAIKFGPDNTLITGHTNGEIEVLKLSEGIIPITDNKQNNTQQPKEEAFTSSFFSSFSASAWWAKNKTRCLWTGTGITLCCAITLALKYKLFAAIYGS